MEFTIITESSGHTTKSIMESLKFISISNEFLVQLMCDEREYKENTMHESINLDIDTETTMLHRKKWVTSSGNVIFKHPTTQKTAILPYTSTCILYMQKRLYITKIHDIIWQDHNYVQRFLGVLESLVRVNCISWREYKREDKTYIAVSQKEMTNLSLWNQCEKKKFKLLNCQFHVNVAFKNKKNNTFVTMRSMILPLTLLNTNPIPKSEIFFILSVEQNNFPSSLWWQDKENLLFGHITILLDKYDFLGFNIAMSELHTLKEYQRLQSVVFPKAFLTEDACTEDVEFITLRGKETWKISFHKCNNLFLLVFTSLDANHPT